MKTETIEKIFNFLNTKEGRKIPKKWADTLAKYEEKKELIRVLETHPDGVQYKYYDSIYLMNTNIKKLPNDLYVTGDLDLAHCKQLTKLPDKLHVNGSLYLSGCQQLTELPNNLYVEYSLDLNDTNIEKLPNNLYVGRNLYIYNTPIFNKYTDEEIREMITSKGGKINGRIIRFF